MIQITIDNSTDARSLRIMADMLQAMADARETKSADTTASHPRQWPDLINKAPVMQKDFKSGTGPTVSTAAAGESLAIHEVESCPSHDVADFDGDTGLEVDISGLPWDGRIHSSNRAKNSDGTWRRRRGIDDELFNSVTAELRGEVAAVEVPKSMTGTDMTSISTDAQTQTATEADPTSAAEVTARLQAPTASSLFAPPPPPTLNSQCENVIAVNSKAPTAIAVNFATLVDHIVKNKLDAATVTAACSAEGAASLAVLGAQPDKVAAVARRLGL